MLIRSRGIILVANFTTWALVCDDLYASHGATQLVQVSLQAGSQLEKGIAKSIVMVSSTQIAQKIC